jgi:hypothetical protein
MSAGNSRAAAYKYRKRMRLEDNCNNVPERTELNAERQREYRETNKNLSAEYMRNYRERKAQENKTPQPSTSTDPTPTPITYTRNYNQANEYFQKNCYGNLFSYACDICDRLWYMNYLKQVNEKRF